MFTCDWISGVILGSRIEIRQELTRRFFRSERGIPPYLPDLNTILLVCCVIAIDHVRNQ